MRQVFGKRIGGLAVAFEVLDQETLQQALEIQARYCALQMAEKPVDMAEPWQTAPLFTRIRDTQSEEVGKALSIGKKHLELAREYVRNAAYGMPAEHVPAMGVLLHALGAVERPVIQSLLTVQAAERILRTAEALITEEAPQDGLSLDKVKTAPLWGRFTTPGDPESLVAAQQMWFVSQLLEAAVRIHTPLEGTKPLARAEAALVIVALGTFREAKESFPALASQVDAIIKEESARWNVENPVTPALMHAALQAISNSVESVDISLGHRYAQQVIAKGNPG